MGEMRLDAHLDAPAAVARYMELLKLASLIERHPRPEELPAAIAEINSLLTQTASAEQRQSSTWTPTSTSCCSRPSARTCGAGGSWTSTPRCRWRRTCRSAAAG